MWSRLHLEKVPRSGDDVTRWLWLRIVIFSQFASLPPCGRTCCTVKCWYTDIKLKTRDILIISALVSRSCGSVSFRSGVGILYCRLYFKLWQLRGVIFLSDLSCVRNQQLARKQKYLLWITIWQTLAEANPVIFRPGPFCPSYYWTKHVGESSSRLLIRFIIVSLKV